MTAARLPDLRNWLSGDDGKPGGGTEEETQGLLGLAHHGLSNVAEKAGNSFGRSLGGNMGMAMQVASISQQQWLAFFVLLLIGGLLMAISFASLPLIVLAPHKFAGVFTAGSLFFLGSFAALRGVSDFVAHLTSKEKLPLTAAYFGSMLGTLWASLWYRSTLLTMVLSAVQITQLLWFFVSYIPGGSAVMGIVCDFCHGAVRRACCSCLRRPSSMPL